ncbi:amidase family protein [Sorangium sp. So ce1000]|uniref:amidase family protein n=1 Tax=Sorangium sp. So ce1000 TaxID=3133325 RepID=UPI003F62A497
MSASTDPTHLSATALAALLAAREISSEELIRAHLSRIDALEPRLRAFTQVLRDEALAAARGLDEERRRGDVRGPLHGLPITVKESLDMAGMASTLGVASRRGHRATGDAEVIALLRRAGAVILGRTNVSQLLLYNEARNPLFGQTANPWSLEHSPGGSSGGEAAAIAAGMSPLGIGTDIGGSIRVPAHSCGIVGLKPTLDRWTNKGSNTALLGQEAIRAQVGPMARSARDVALVMSELDPASMAELDVRVPPLPLVEPASVEVARLRVGFYCDDGLVPPSTAVARAVVKAASALRARGATVVPFTPPGIPDAVYAYFAALSADGGATALSLLDGGEGTDIDVSLRSLRTMASLPSFARRATARVAGLAGERRLQRLLEVTGPKSVSEFWRTTHALREARAAIASAMRAEALDLLLCPPYATPALPHTASRDFVLAGSAAMLWNLTQFPAGVVPVTRVRAEETRRERPRDRLEKRAAEIDAKSDGLPVGVQVVGFPFSEHLVLAAMIAIEDELAGETDRPVTPVSPPSLAG